MIKFCSLLVALVLLSAVALAQAPGGPKFPPLTAEQLRIFTGLNKPIPSKEMEARLRAQASQMSESETTTVTIVNSASLLACGLSTNPNKCTNGMFLTFYVSPMAVSTSALGTFPFPGVFTLSDGFQLRYESCSAPPNNARETRILGAYQHPGYQQVNIYVYGDVLETQGEPEQGPCNFVNNGFTATFNVRARSGIPLGTPFGNATGGTRFVSVNMNLATPAIFTQNGSGIGGAPAGFHYNSATFVYTELRDCNVNPSLCPITSNGISNYLVLYTTGAENIQCGNPATPATCQSLAFLPGILFRTSAGTSTTIQPFVIQEILLGQEQWNIPIDMLSANQQYTLTVVSGASDVSVQALAVRFGPGN
ncbi:MAG: hypothetical protein ACREEM_26465 [Blastocatellia bacterium]